MALPNLPGFDFSYQVGKDKYHKSHHFDTTNNVQMWVGETKTGIGGDQLPGQKAKNTGSYFPRYEASRLPAWIAFDKQVLSFDCMFQEAVTERRDEQYRVRKCKIYFYLEDDSMQVVEPRVKNSQLAQGTIIRRHRIPKPPPDEDKYYTVDDLNVGREIMLYNRVFKLIDCDPFTRNFLTKLGIDVPGAFVAPEDPYSSDRKAMAESMQPLRPYERRDTLKQFLDHDGHVLRFYGYWDDRESLFGDERFLTVHYFLADDTIEVHEQVKPNSGSDMTSCFLHRGRLPKSLEAMPLPGKVTDRTVLNVFGELNKNRFILDSLKTGAYQPEFYKDLDLSIGAVLNVFGRKIKLFDCDEFTKTYYRTKYGVSDFAPLPVRRPPDAPAKPDIPPYTGFGSEEDSLTSCQATLQPKPVQRDLKKFLALDRQGSESHELRFTGRFINAKPVDAERVFILSYYLMDDTVMINEPLVRNSGHQGGRFLARQKIKRPNQERFSTMSPDYFVASDFYIGAVLNINNYLFRIVDADEYCLRYMEQNAAAFPQADVGRIVQKLSLAASRLTVDQLFQLCTAAAGGSIDTPIRFLQLKPLLDNLTDSTLTDHEMLTVARYYGNVPDVVVDMHMVAYLAQDELRKQNYDLYGQRLHEALLEQDASKSGSMQRGQLANILKSTHVPLDYIVIDHILNGLADAADVINYQELMKLLDWKRYPVVTPPNYVGSVNRTLVALIQEQVLQSQRRVLNINLQKLFEDIKPVGAVTSSG